MPNFKTYKSRSRIFTPRDVLKPIYDYGQTVEFCQMTQVAPSDAETGVPAQKTIKCRKVRGYVTVDSGQQMKVNEGLSIDGSGYTAYIYGGDVRVSQITRDSLIAFKGSTFHLYLIQAHGDKDSAILLELRLLRTPGGVNVEQPDEIIETTPMLPGSLEIPIEEVDPLFQP